MQALLQGLHEAEVGRGRLFLLGGEPGIGKTRLADEFTARVEALVCWGRCWEAGGAPAYWPWIQVLRSLIPTMEPEVLRERLGVGAAHAAQILPELREQLADLPDPPPASPETARFRLFDALTDLLIRSAQDQPLVLVLEDLHAADSSSLLLLRFVGAEVSRTRMLILATYRDVELTRDHPLVPTLAELIRLLGTAQLQMSGLTVSDVARYVRTVTGQMPPDAVVAAIHRESEGNPLFVGELVQLLIAEGLADGTIPDHWPIPEGIREVIGRRLDRLSAECRRVLTLASVVGRDFTVDALERLADGSAEVLLDSLRDAATARVVTSVSGIPGGYRFAHSLIRDTLYEDLAPSERVRLHRRVAEALEQLYRADADPHVAELAHHFFEAVPAGEKENAIEYGIRAGASAAARLAYEDAVRLYEKVLSLVERASDEERRCELLLALGDAQDKAGESAASKASFLEAAEIATRLDMAERLARAALGYGGRFVWLRAGTDREVIPLLERALAALGPEDSPLRVRLLARLTGALRDQPSPEPRASLSREALDMARRLGDRPTLLVALEGRWGAALQTPASGETSLDIAEEVARVAEEIGDRERAADACWHRFIEFIHLGRVAEARMQETRLRRLAAELREPSLRWYAGVMATILALQDGRFDEVDDLIADTLEIGQRAQSWDAGASRLFALFVLRREQGRLAEIEDDLWRALEDYPGYRSVRCMLAVTFGETGRDDQARDLFEALAADDFAALPKDNEWLFALSLLAEVADRLGDRDRARILFAQLSPYASLVGQAASEVSTGPIHRPLGILSSLMGRYDEAEVHFEESIQRTRRMGARSWLAHTHHAYARMCLARNAPGDRERAVELATAANLLAADLGMTALERRTADLLGELGVEGRRETGAVAQGAPDRPAVFRREGEYFAIAFEGDSFRLKDTKGLRYLGHLLAGPGREVHALDLVVVVEGGPSGGARRVGSAEVGLDVRGAGDAGEFLDPEARSAYRSRLEELREDLEEAESFGDPERASRARAEMDFLAQELAAAVGLGGRDRKAASAAERARQSVTKAIKSAVDRIAEHSPALGRYLRSTVRTGTFCAYMPDPGDLIRWVLSR